MQKYISIFSAFLITSVLIICISCSNSDSGSGSAPGTLNSNIAGIWQYISGENIDGMAVDELKFIRFSEDGTAAFFYENTFHVLSNEFVLFAVLNNNTVLIGMKKSLSNTPESAYVINDAGNSSKQMPGPGTLYTYNRPDSSTLTLTDSSQNTISFASAAQVPEGLVMKEFTVQEEYRDLEIEPSDWTNLVWDGTYLWYEEADYTDLIYPFDPVSGQLLTNSSVSFSSAGSYTHIRACQSGYFWTDCGCGNNENASLRDPGTNGGEIDLVDTDDAGSINNKISISGIAWDNDNSYLWLAGYNYDLAEYQFLKVNSNAEPDTLEGVYEFGSAGNMTWDGTYFWMISWGGIIKIDPDPAGFTAADTYYSPDANIDLAGIAAVGSDIYILGIDDDKENKGVIFKVTP